MRLLIGLIPALLCAQMYTQPSALSKQHTLVVGLAAKWSADAMHLDDGAAIATWSDVSPNHNTATQVTGASQPTLHRLAARGRDMVTLSGSTFLNVANSAALSFSEPFSAYYVVTTTASSGQNFLVYKTDSYDIGWSALRPSLLLPSKFQYTSVYHWQNTSVLRIIGVEFDGVSAKFYVNGCLKETISNTRTVAVNSNSLTIGTDGFHAWVGDVAQIELYSRILTAPERVRTWARLCAAYQIYCSTPEMDADLAVAAGFPANPLTFDTYETVVSGAKQITEPSAVYFPGGWNGHNYWLEATPHGDTVPVGLYDEAPAIYYSDDKTTWTCADPTCQPIETTAHTLGAYADPSIAWNPADNKLYVYYEDYTAGPPTRVKVWARSSADGVTWSARQLMVDVTGVGSVWSAGCPAVIYNGTEWRMYMQNAAAFNAGGSGLGYRSAPGPLGPWSDEVANKIEYGDVTVQPDHINFNYENGAYYGWIMPLGGARLYVITSRDGVSWQSGGANVSPRGLFTDAAPAWCGTQRYRSTATRSSPGVWDFWVSCISTSGTGSKFGIGYTTISGI